MAAVLQQTEAPVGSGTARRGPSGSTWRYVGTKCLASFASLVFVVCLNFFLFRLLPGDPAKMLTRNRNITPEAVAALRERWGLDEGLLSQFWRYVRSLATGDLGNSLKFQQPVSSVIAGRIWPTVLLVGISTVLATLIGVWIGIRAGWRRNGSFDKVSTATTLTFYSMPEFWLGMILILVFSLGWGPIPGIFPTSGLVTPGVDMGSVQGWFDVASHLALPVITLTLVYLADYSLIMRSSLIDELGADYLTTARAKGLRDADVRKRHAVPNALLPTVTLIVLYLGFVVSGAITIETVFSIPGLGLLSYEALRVPDYPLLQGLFLLFSAGVILANLVADLLYPILDPRVRPA